MNVVTLKLYFV